MRQDRYDREYLISMLCIWEWRYERKDSFKDKLFDLMDSADQYQRAKLARVYPVEFAAYTAWRYSPDGDKFLNDMFPEKQCPN